MIDEYFRFAIKSIKYKGIRSLLTLLGIVIGVATIVTLISLGQGMQAAVTEQFGLLGFDTIYIMPGADLIGFGSGAKFTDHDIKLVRQVHGVDLADGFDTRLAKVKYRDEIVYVWISGLPVGEAQDLLLDGTGIEVVRGQKKFKPSDTYKCAVGYEHWMGNTFDQPVEIGDNIYIHDKKFEIVAFISRIGNEQDDSNIYIPFETFKELFGTGDEYVTIMVRVKGGYEPLKVAEDIKKKLRRDRGLEKGEEDFTVITMEQMAEIAGAFLTVLQAVVVVIGLISVAVGGIGIMNMMYTSVLERTREIGVMKAIGARNMNVLYLFLIESGVIGMVGGTVGILVGATTAKLVEFAIHFLSHLGILPSGLDIIQANISLELVIGALAFSFIVGSVFGVLPAYQASKLNPVDALRYE